MSSTPPPVDFFTKEQSENYDARNSKLAPIGDNMHFLIRLLGKQLPTHAHVLCVGVGTGSEILSLAKTYPGWTFVGIDPSASMLEVCARNLNAANIASRCTLVHGYVQDVPTGETFDAALGILVAHFIPQAERLAFFQHMVNRLRPHGMLVNTEISADMDAPAFPLQLKGWEEVQFLMGATPESLANLPHLLRNVLTVLPPAHTEDILRQSGIDTPAPFFQSFLIHGWYGFKRGT